MPTADSKLSFVKQANSLFPELLINDESWGEISAKARLSESQYRADNTSAQTGYSLTLHRNL